MNEYSLMGLWNPLWNIGIIVIGVVLVAFAINYVFELVPTWLNKTDLDGDDLVICLILGAICIHQGLTRAHGAIWDFSFAGSHQVWGLMIIICGIATGCYGLSLPSLQCFEETACGEVIGGLVSLCGVGLIIVAIGLAILFGAL